MISTKIPEKFFDRFQEPDFEEDVVDSDAEPRDWQEILIDKYMQVYEVTYRKFDVKQRKFVTLTEIAVDDDGSLCELITEKSIDECTIKAFSGEAWLRDYRERQQAS